MKRQKGISVFEIIMVIGIASILGSISVSVFVKLSNATSLDKDTSIVLSYIDKARTMSLNSVNSITHGVKLQSDRIIVFSGASYTGSNSEATFVLPTKSRVLSVSLSNNNNEFYFNKLSGTPSATGTVVVVDSGGEISKTIVIYATGLSEVQ